MTLRAAGVLALIALGSVACRVQRDAMAQSDSVELADRGARLEQRLADSVSGAARGAPIGRWLLPPNLNEVSGLAMTSDGRVLAHGDEFGSISVIDPRRGVLLKEFSIGAKADFEGITSASGTIYMVASNGQVYAFREGENGKRVSYEMHDTRLGKECEFEGVAYDSRRSALLLPCKNVAKRSLRNNVVIYIWRIDNVAPRVSVLTIPLRRAIGDNPWTHFRPTDITVDKRTRNYVLVAANERALLEITPNGEVVRSLPLPGGSEEHPQAEGIAVTEDGILIVADEARSRPASLTLYRWPLAPATQVAP